MYLFWIISLITLCLMITAAAILNNDKEAILYAVAMVIGYFILKGLIYAIDWISSQTNLALMLQNGILTFLKYLTVSLIFIFAVVCIYPFFKDR